MKTVGMIVLAWIVVGASVYILTILPKIFRTILRKKKRYVVQTSSDDGRTWSNIAGYDDENTAINKKKEIDHRAGGWVEARVIER